MISNKPKFLTVVLPLATFISVGIAQSASARQPKCRDVERTFTVPTDQTYYEPPVEVAPGIVRAGYTANYTTKETRIVNECRSDTSIGAAFNFGNGSPGYGVSGRYSIFSNGAVAIRGTYLFTQDKNEHGTLAVTREIDLGSADLFIGAGYNADKREPVESVEKKGFNYPFATVGVDYRITPSIDLNTSILIPINGGSNAINYNIGIALNF
jgi:hypothetical protein